MTFSLRTHWPIAALGLLAWAYFPTLAWMVEKWYDDPQYSHGFLVPVVSGYLLYRRQQTGQPWLGTPWPILGAAVLLLAVAGRALGGGLLFHQLDAVAMLASLAGIALVYGGGRLMAATAPALAFLVFMIPLPYELEQNIGGPLKVVATEASTFLLQTLGFAAVPEGNIIRIEEVELGVVDACNGLKMLMTFSCFAGGAVLLLDRTWFEKGMIVLGVVPIAVLANVLRITATGIVYTFVFEKAARASIHDNLGLLMMPVGLGLLAFQLWALKRLVVRMPAPSTEIPLAAPRPAFA